MAVTFRNKPLFTFNFADDPTAIAPSEKKFSEGEIHKKWLRDHVPWTKYLATSIKVVKNIEFIKDTFMVILICLLYVNNKYHKHHKQ